MFGAICPRGTFYIVQGVDHDEFVLSTIGYQSYINKLTIPRLSDSSISFILHLVVETLTFVNVLLERSGNSPFHLLFLLYNSQILLILSEVTYVLLTKLKIYCEFPRACDLFDTFLGYV